MGNGNLDRELLKIAGLSYSYPGAPAPALSELTFTVRTGECVCLTGNSGCGKSTLLLAIMGLLRSGTMTGSIEYHQTGVIDRWSRAAGIVLQDPESQLRCSTVAEEVACGPENLGVPLYEVARRVKEALLAVGLTGQETRRVEHLSAGQKQRLAIASVLSMNPRLLLLDEPTSRLDAKGKRELLAVLADLKWRGYTLILVEHDPRPFGSLIDRCLSLEQGRCRWLSFGSVLAATTASSQDPPHSPRTEPLPCRAQEQPACIEVHGLGLSYPETGEVFKEVAFRIKRGERVHLSGRNGAGKSSLLRCLAGLERPGSGTVRLPGLDLPRPEHLPDKVGLLSQGAARQLLAETVWDEVAISLARLESAPEDTGRLVAEALGLCGIAHLAGRAPGTLSYGEQHRVALAALLAPRPELLLLDEPFAGLDFPQRLAVLDILARMPLRGSTVLVASHDELPDPRWADRSFLLRDGSLVETA